MTIALSALAAVSALTVVFCVIYPLTRHDT
jgi:hypothetical protein